MIRASEHLKTVNDLSEQTPMLRVLAAKLEPFAERVADHAADIGKYEDDSTSDEQRAQTQTQTDSWEAPSGELLDAVNELRALADKIDGALRDTRGLRRTSHRDMLEAIGRPIGAGKGN